jgi:peptidoglycan hydrolase CwlO-like protein
MRTTARPDRARPFSGRRLAILAVASVALGLLPTASLGAQTSTNAASDVATLRAQADGIANQYFHALTRSHELDDEVAQNAQTVDALEAKAKEARRNARARALLAYTTSSTHLSTLIEGKSILATARRARLIDNVNQRDNAVYSKLKATTQDLRASRKALEDARAEQSTVLAQIQDQAKALDAKLAEAEARQQAAAVAATTTAAPVDPAAASSAAAPTGATTATAAPATQPPATTTPPARPTTPTAPPDYSPTPGASPHHDDPFLTCVRARESGGNYGAVNPAGPYLGAYQFYPSTWNAAANHANRSDLVGVPANLASPYDQDEVAWSLYQWQGMGPWGGHCP